MISGKVGGNPEFLTVKNSPLVIRYGYEIWQHRLFIGVGWAALGTEACGDGDFHISRIGIFVKICLTFHGQISDAAVDIDVHEVSTWPLSKLHNSRSVSEDAIIWAWQNGRFIPEADHPIVSVFSAVSY